MRSAEQHIQTENSPNLGRHLPRAEAKRHKKFRGNFSSATNLSWNTHIMEVCPVDPELLKDREISKYLPKSAAQTARNGTNQEYLDILARLLVAPKSTTNIFHKYKQFVVELCNRWESFDDISSITKLTAIARLVRAASYLAAFAEDILFLLPTDSNTATQRARALQQDGTIQVAELENEELRELLLALLRLLKFDNVTFAKAVCGAKLQPLLYHDDNSVRYLAIQVLSLYLHAADAAVQTLVKTYVTDGPITGAWEGKDIDYLFLPLWEAKRIKELLGHNIDPVPKTPKSSYRALTTQDLSIKTAKVGNAFFRKRLSHSKKSPSIVLTASTEQNLQSFAGALLELDPILLVGRAGCGKTRLVEHVAQELGEDSQMITLHLNEQTDAKMLLGMYTSDNSPGSFKWRSGVLTTAVKEGRWVLIEDLDRAPTDVLGVLLPLIEHRKLEVSSRGETINAAKGFRLIATMRSHTNAAGEESSPAANMIGLRLWSSVKFKVQSQDECCEIVQAKYPLLQGLLPRIMAVFKRIIEHRYSDLMSSTVLRIQREGTNLRELLKWCERLNQTVKDTGAISGSEALRDNVHDNIFMEAVDCFAGSIQDMEAKKQVVALIAEELHIPPQKAAYFLNDYSPEYEDLQNLLKVGRCRLSKVRIPKHGKHRISKQPFALTSRTRRTIEQVGVAVQHREPVLLVGETGTGKTTVLQELADSIGQKLVVVNLSQQSESGDLLGGFKPVNVRRLAIPMKEEFDELFESTFSLKKNQKYLDSLNRSLAKEQWARASTLWHEALKMKEAVFKLGPGPTSNAYDRNGDKPSKRRKVISSRQGNLEKRWNKFQQQLQTLDLHISGGAKGFAFTYVEGKIVQAVRNGDWVLLDEINLASSDTLESIADLLQRDTLHGPSILLSETGNVEKIQAHPNFRIFGAMNPAIDVGKKDLPGSIRSRFTELYVSSPDSDLESLLSIVSTCLGDLAKMDGRAVRDVSHLYLATRRLAEENRIVDGAGQRPHFSLRTLTRALSYAVDVASNFGLRRALYEAFSMSFLTTLNRESERLMVPLIEEHLVGSNRNIRSLLGQTPRLPSDGKQYISFKNYWMPRGNFPLIEQPHYIITPFVERNLLNLVRATSSRRFPILIQGPTSSGKTSMIQYLAETTGNRCVRINNHEHTDLQEYLGSYATDEDGQLSFREGILVRALREGHWVILDELNLAPTDVLEALNRLLDDNRELLVPETQEVVRPHPDFMLFATQNPPGLYGGRKSLSRAFRNRFLELHFDDIPEDELETILRERTQIAPSFCSKIVAVYKELSVIRQTERIFEQRNSFATLRDLFRWAFRDADDREQLALNGYMLLGERVRKEEEKQIVKSTIEKVMKVSIDEENQYSKINFPESSFAFNDPVVDSIVWTKGMKRLYALVSQALLQNEPVLLVGETGCGKTSICQILAKMAGKQLYSVNAHQNTETGDLIGAQRPVRNRSTIEKRLTKTLNAIFSGETTESINSKDSFEALIQRYEQLSVEELSQVPTYLKDQLVTGQTKLRALFEWSDGALVQAMKEGQFFLLDEISLADDSVLERLNSVLESKREILLAEKGPDDSHVEAQEGFQFVATMNPGGEYGKRELSPALRNRFTEIWVPAVSDLDDIVLIALSRLESTKKVFASPIVAFAQWFNERFNSSASRGVSIRDINSWIDFINSAKELDPLLAMVHGAAMVYIDTLGANPAAVMGIPTVMISEERQSCLKFLSGLLKQDVSYIYQVPSNIVVNQSYIKIGEFSIPCLPTQKNTSSSVNLRVPTTRANALRVLRALQIRKPILLEGNPGVGKTGLITALAELVGRPLVRINLSEQTDLMDLFGSDVPEGGASAGRFAWHDGPFLQAMQQGHWVLLDEMNLASQSVLEGLNACLDHRGSVYVSELDQTFSRHPEFTVFAAQNPHQQGSGRKGLPSSFVNRFTVVYTEALTSKDMTEVCEAYSPLALNSLDKLVRLVTELNQMVVEDKKFGYSGSPWEFNLRDLIRWLQLLLSRQRFLRGAAFEHFVDLLFTQRFRTDQDRKAVRDLTFQIFSTEGHDPTDYGQHHFRNLGNILYQVGRGSLLRNQVLNPTCGFAPEISKSKIPTLESLMICVQQGWPCILVGPSGAGKSAMLGHLASMLGVRASTLSLNSEIDAIDLVGGYEQVDSLRSLNSILHEIEIFLRDFIISSTVFEADIKEAYLMLDHLIRAGTPATDLGALYRLLQTLSSSSTSSTLLKLLKDLKFLIDEPSVTDRAAFEWVDGLLVHALTKGDWLILDNANLCSPSVLDRLNSLLEPGGSLMITEHHTEDGNPRVVRPHPNFRIFLTMDPRHGELSRAMRNRAIELYLPQPSSEALEINHECQNSQMFRLESWCSFLDQDINRELTIIDVDTATAALSESDIELLPRIMSQRNLGLVPNVDDRKGTFSFSTRKFHSLLFSETGSHAKVYNVIAKALQLPLNYRKFQPVHPLSDYSLITMHNLNIPQTMIRLATLMDAQLEIYDMANILQEVQRKSEILKVRDMTLLQRSAASERVQNLRNEITRPAMSFLVHMQEGFQSFISFLSDGSGNFSEQEVFIFKKLVSSWWHLYFVTDQTKFAGDALQVFLEIGQEIIAESKVNSNFRIMLLGPLADGLETFQSRMKMTSGLSMKKLWVELRPPTAQTIQGVEDLLKLESLADRTDAISWQAEIPLNQIKAVKYGSADSRTEILNSGAPGESLLEGMRAAIAELEANVGSAAEGLPPYFSEEFEALCQYHDLKGPIQSESLLDSNISQSLLVLANRSTKYLKSSSSTKVHGIFSDLMAYSGRYAKPVIPLAALQGSLPAQIMKKCVNMDNVQLGQLDLFRTELNNLSTGVVLSTNRILDDQCTTLAAILFSIIYHLLQVHYDMASPPLVQCREDDSGIYGILKRAFYMVTYPLDGSSTPKNADFVLATHLYLSPAIENLRQIESYPIKHQIEGDERWNLLSQTFILMSLAFIFLYIPDQAYDPALRNFIEKENYIREREKLVRKLSAMKNYTQNLTGQTQSYRAHVLEVELQQLGKQPQVPKIARPSVSKIPELQVEFKALLDLVKTFGLVSLREVKFPGKDKVKSIQMNISAISQRLSSNYREYDDLVIPAVNILQCLEIGLSIQEMSENSTLGDDHYEGLNFLPFIRYDSFNFGQNVPTQNKDGLVWHKLRTARLRQNIESEEHSQMFQESGRKRGDEVMSIFHNLYVLWKEQLSLDQEEALKKSSLYRYRGGEDAVDEREDEEFHELFPDFELSNKRPPKTSQKSDMDPAELAALTAEAHAHLFLEPATEYSIKQFIKDSFGIFTSLNTEKRILSSRERNYLLSPMLLSIAEVNEHLTQNEMPKKPANFYIDPNLVEASRLTNLVKVVKWKFAKLQEAWPEHTTIQDVLDTCSQTTSQKHVEPLAKLITSLEKLHNYVHQWQLVASREFSAIKEYDLLTSLIVDWRRHELSTWGRLFDAEQEKCEQDAQSWWFIAYEVVIAAPMSMRDDPEQLSAYAQKLLANLEAFFKTTSLGQFQRRLQLLKQLKGQMCLISSKSKALRPVFSALSNFIQFYGRFLDRVVAVLAEGRQKLEKDVKEVILLASWKDTNIAALRDSAKRSHVKLFRIVRKYRNLLGKPAESILIEGIPKLVDQITIHGSKGAIHVSESPDFPTELALIKFCEAHAASQWGQRSQRLVDAGSTSKTMEVLTRLPKSSFDISEYFDSFDTTLASSIAELRKITPAVSTEKNKEFIKHLKTRKRKLFADTLKSIREWGIRHNLGQNVLAEQSSITDVLASLPALPNLKSLEGLEGLGDVDENLHRYLDMMSRNRILARNASEELSANEVARSMGYLEGFCYEIRKQRALLATSLEASVEINKAVNMVANLWCQEQYETRWIERDYSIFHIDEIQKTMCWLPSVLEAGSKIIEVHGQLGQLDHSEVIFGLNEEKSDIKKLSSEWKALPLLPTGLCSSLYIEHTRRSVVKLQGLRTQLDIWRKDHPLISFVFDQINDWIGNSHDVPIDGRDNIEKTFDIAELEEEVTQTCDAVLVTVQDLQKKISDMPTSEDPSWLVTRRKVIESSLQSLRAKEVVERLENCLKFFVGRRRNTSQLPNAMVCAGLVSSVLPILRQYERIHRENIGRLFENYQVLSRMALLLSGILNKLLHQGFCSPSEKSGAQEGNAEKLEDGTGLGDGEGAEDISKDIADDEDLSELAQEPNKKEDREEIEDEKDAVEMQDEMEGEMGDVSDKGEDEEKDSGDEESGDDMDEEVGDVGDLDPSTVDERLWDEKAKETEKEQEGEKSKGQKSKDEQAAAQEDAAENENISEDGSDSEDIGVEESEEIGCEMPEKTDPHTQEGENLDLPEDMDLDGDGKSEATVESDDEEMNAMSDVDDGEGEDLHPEDNENEGVEENDEGEAKDDEMDATRQDLDTEDEFSDGEEEEKDPGAEKEEQMDQGEENDSENLLHDRADDAKVDEDNIAPSDAQGVEIDQDQAQDQDENQPNTSKAKREHGSKGDASAENDKPAEEGQLGHQANADTSTGQDDQLQDTREMQAFKKLGDSIDRWHRQQKEIQNASEDQKKEAKQDGAAAAEQTDFEHLMNDENKSDAQALGTATEEQAHALDESMALDMDSKQESKDFQPDEVDNQPEHDGDVEMEESQPVSQQQKDKSQDREESQTFIGAAKSTAMEVDAQDKNAPAEEFLDDIDDHLSTIQLDQDQDSLRPLDSANQLWKHYESQTRDLSFTLTEQLRLILAPTLATKMRGDFRTGKRLNIKRIIPYIASQYKRDKIWMRRSVPSKRAYQIMLAVDDSKSMGESGSGELAFETLALVSKSLSMLEVGQICVVGFGETVKVAHEFDKPFSSEAGVQVFRQFSFDQQRTDVRKLVEESLGLFREARTKSMSSSSQTDLWQLQLIISDGICEEHESLRRLVRQAQEERVMIVFVIVDNKAGSKGGSIMQMSRASFEKDDVDGQMKLKMRRYMDDFPFNYYLVVRDVKQLPAVLSQALRGWFSEVVEGS